MQLILESKLNLPPGIIWWNKSRVCIALWQEYIEAPLVYSHAIPAAAETAQELFSYIFSPRVESMNEKVIVNIDQLKARLNKDVKDIEAAQSLGNAYYDRGDTAMAVLYYRHVLDIDPALSGVRTDLGAMYWRNENISLAEQAFREVIARDPGFGHAYVNLGLLLQLARYNITEARSVWQQLVDLNPEHEVADRARELLQETAMLIN